MPGVFKFYCGKRIVGRKRTRKHHGLGIPHLWTTQGIEKLWAIFRHGDADTIPGHQIRCSLECAMVETGIPAHLLTHAYQDFHHLCTPSWISSIWEFVDHFKLSLYDNLPTVPLQCEHDQFLTPTFARYNIPKAIIRLANVCRLWLRVWRISDIATGDGREILNHYWDGSAPSLLTPQFDWPRSERPSAAAWRAWRLALSHLTVGATRVLTQTLQSWTVPPDYLRNWFFSAAERRLYKPTPTGLQVYIPSNQRANRRPRFAYTIIPPRSPFPTRATEPRPTLAVICSFNTLDVAPHKLSSTRRPNIGRPNDCLCPPIWPRYSTPSDLLPPSDCATAPISSNTGPPHLPYRLVTNAKAES